MPRVRSGVLALDLMEVRAPFADRFALTLVNRRQLAVTSSSGWVARSKSAMTAGAPC